MSESDDKILELLAEGGMALNKKTMEVNFDILDIDISYSTLKRRLPILERAGLVDLVREQGKYYQISDEGLQYLSGEHRPPDLEPDES